MLLPSLSDDKPVDSMFTVSHIRTIEMAVGFSAVLLFLSLGEAARLDTYFFMNYDSVWSTTKGQDHCSTKACLFAVGLKCEA